MKRMLVVEDDYLSQETLKRIFRDKFEIDICESVEIFHEKFSNIKYDIIILDISLRGKLTGLDLTKGLKSSEFHSNIPILCLTAHSFRNDKKNALDAGVDLFVVKPVEVNQLRSYVSELIENFSKSTED